MVKNMLHDKSIKIIFERKQAKIDDTQEKHTKDDYVGKAYYGYHRQYSMVDTTFVAKVQHPKNK